MIGKQLTYSDLSAGCQSRPEQWEFGKVMKGCCLEGGIWVGVEKL